jgi:hypothetical protein
MNSTFKQWLHNTLFYLLGVCTGATGITYFNSVQPLPARQPVVVEREIRVPIDIEPLKTSLETHLIRQEAHLVKMQQALVKLSTMNKVQSAQLIEREPMWMGK